MFFTLCMWRVAQCKNPEEDVVLPKAQNISTRICVRVLVGIIKPNILSFLKHTSERQSKESERAMQFFSKLLYFLTRPAGFPVGPQSGLGIGKKASHFALIFTSV